jgi:predicted porin
VLSPKLYPGIFALKPQVFASYSHYPRFDVQQISAIPQLRWRDIALEAAVHYSYLDNEPVSADSTKLSVQVKLNKQLPFGLNLGLHYGSGNDSWLIDSSGALIDTFAQNSAYYGVSLFYPFLKRFSLYGYTQINKADQLWYVSLAGRY